MVNFKPSLHNCYYYYYMISLHNLINTYNCAWDFHSINEKQHINGTNLKYTDFTHNEYLKKYENEKIGLAEDILNNGMYFPYFVYGLPEEQENNIIHLALGKHRYYSKLLYQHKNNKLIEDKFLFIYVPDILPKVTHRNLNKYYYKFNCNNFDVTISDNVFVNSRKELMIYFDIVGGKLSRDLAINQIPTNPILNDEELFRQFIESPLDENNIMFKYYEELKEAE